MAVSLSKRKFLIGIPVLIVGSRVGIAFSSQQTYGVLGTQKLTDARIADCKLIESEIEELRTMVRQLDNMSPTWYSERIKSLEAGMKEREDQLNKHLKKLREDRTIELIGAVGESIAFVASLVAGGALLVGSTPIVIGVAAGVSVLAGVSTFTIQTIFKTPDRNATIEFIGFHAWGRAGFLLGAGKNLLKNLSFGMAFVSAAYASGKAVVTAEEVEQFEAVVESLRSEVQRMTTDEKFAISVLKESLKNNITVLESIKAGSSNCMPKLVPVKLMSDATFFLR
ncbi:hypothetical protein [Vibrio parahaemolyticus]|uniref:hypothetical protein n=1 Tax=Vibrio parahaemolyticus TaxID=670 RepID=UPI0032974B0E